MNESIEGLFKSLNKIKKMLQGYTTTSYMINEPFNAPFQAQGSEYDSLRLSTHTLVINTPTVWKPYYNTFKKGSLALATPDGTASGGNLRGFGAVDLQMQRSLATDVASGEFSFSAGNDNTTSGSYATTIGSGNKAQGTGAIAIGAGNTSGVGLTGYAIGTSNSCGQNYATAIGHHNTANGYESLAIGYSNYTSVEGAVSIGYDNATTGTRGVTIGDRNNATASNAVAIGVTCTGSGMYSLAMGQSTTASGTSSIAIGAYTIAETSYTSAFGYCTRADGIASHAFGCSSTTNYRKNATILGSWGKSNTDTTLSIGFKGDNNSYTTLPLQGKYQRTIINLIGISTTDTAITLTADGSGSVTVADSAGGTVNSYFIPVSSTALVRYNLLGVTADGASATRFQGEVHIRKETSASSIVILNQSSVQTGDASLDGATMSITANTTTGTLDFSVTGIASTSIKWSLIADSDEVKYHLATS